MKCPKCGLGQACTGPGDCQSGNCMAGTCQMLPCQNGKKDGNETDTDCGGGSCGKCGFGKSCLGNADCDTGLCTNKFCASPASCNDGVKNGKETDTDCGGGCPLCSDGSDCLVNGDCSSANCSGGICQAAPNCFDGMLNGTETDVDCGGLKCGACENGFSCKGNSDCKSLGCSLGICCGSGTANCDNNPNNGCEADLKNDKSNCNACGKLCANGQTCNNGVCGVAQMYSFTGVKQSLAIANLTGWTQCHVNTYAANASVATILQKCGGNYLLLGCRQAGSATLTLAAMAPRADVIFDTGANNTTATHLANGVAWYFSSSHSWGFAPSGDKVNLNSCDNYGVGNVVDPNGHGPLRMCWHTAGGSLNSGYRCGATDLNGSNIWERLVYTAN
ncbi:MAG: hypothetical protein EXR72_07225 [Myxococcales bacterium]|nr:hypothetical protein [Myxococcales bacterium]